MEDQRLLPKTEDLGAAVAREVPEQLEEYQKHRRKSGHLGAAAA